MENTFMIEFYPTNKDIQEVWKDSLIVFDTCSLLNLYRYSKATREQYLSVMNRAKERLWMPYHVGEEYFKNRVPTLLSVGIAYENINRKLDVQFQEIESSINNIFKFREDDQNKLIEEVRKGYDKIKKVVSDSKKSRIPFSPNTDSILEDLKKFYENRVGINFTQEEIEKLNKEGEIRFTNKTPPGYCDRSKEDVTKNKFGDLIIWKQIIEKSCKDKKNIILITDDRKEDWWLEVHGRTISPRKELYSEFLLETKQKILIYRPQVFMEYAKEHLKSGVDEKAMKEIIDVSESTELTHTHIPSSYKFSAEDFAKYTGTPGSSLVGDMANAGIPRAFTAEDFAKYTGIPGSSLVGNMANAGIPRPLSGEE